jgi:hypothetical protein
MKKSELTGKSENIGYSAFALIGVLFSLLMILFISALVILN